MSNGQGGMQPPQGQQNHGFHHGGQQAGSSRVTSTARGGARNNMVITRYAPPPGYQGPAQPYAPYQQTAGWQQPAQAYNYGAYNNNSQIQPYQQFQYPGYGQHQSYHPAQYPGHSQHQPYQQPAYSAYGQHPEYPSYAPQLTYEQYIAQGYSAHDARQLASSSNVRHGNHLPNVPRHPSQNNQAMTGQGHQATAPPWQAVASQAQSVPQTQSAPQAQGAPQRQSSTSSFGNTAHSQSSISTPNESVQPALGHTNHTNGIQESNTNPGADAAEEDDEYWREASFAKHPEEINEALSLGTIQWRAPGKLDRAMPAIFAEAELEAIAPKPRLHPHDGPSVYFSEAKRNEQLLNVRQTPQWEEVKDDGIFKEFPASPEKRLSVDEVVEMYRDRRDSSTWTPPRAASASPTPEPALMPTSSQADGDEADVAMDIDGASEISVGSNEPGHILDNLEWAIQQSETYRQERRSQKAGRRKRSCEDSDEQLPSKKRRDYDFGQGQVE